MVYGLDDFEVLRLDRRMDAPTKSYDLECICSSLPEAIGAYFQDLMGFESGDVLEKGVQPEDWIFLWPLGSFQAAFLAL